MRQLETTDIGPLRHILENTQVFTPVEVECAVSLLETVVDDRRQQDYEAIVADWDNNVAGYALFGPIPLTEGNYDLYWIATDPALHGKGLGRQLMQAVETRLRARGTRMLCLETSSQQAYQRTRSFYLRAGYEEAARIRDFYRPGDDRITYIKRFV